MVLRHFVASGLLLLATSCVHCSETELPESLTAHFMPPFDFESFFAKIPIREKPTGVDIRDEHVSGRARQQRNLRMEDPSPPEKRSLGRPSAFPGNHPQAVFLAAPSGFEPDIEEVGDFELPSPFASTFTVEGREVPSPPSGAFPKDFYQGQRKKVEHSSYRLPENDFYEEDEEDHVHKRQIPNVPAAQPGFGQTPFQVPSRFQNLNGPVAEPAGLASPQANFQVPSRFQTLNGPVSEPPNLASPSNGFQLPAEIPSGGPQPVAEPSGLRDPGSFAVPGNLQGNLNPAFGDINAPFGANSDFLGFLGAAAGDAFGGQEFGSRTLERTVHDEDLESRQVPEPYYHDYYAQPKPPVSRHRELSPEKQRVKKKAYQSQYAQSYGDKVQSKPRFPSYFSTATKQPESGEEFDIRPESIAQQGIRFAGITTTSLPSGRPFNPHNTGGSKLRRQKAKKVKKQPTGFYKAGYDESNEEPRRVPGTVVTPPPGFYFQGTTSSRNREPFPTPTFPTRLASYHKEPSHYDEDREEQRGIHFPDFSSETDESQGPGFTFHEQAHRYAAPKPRSDDEFTFAGFPGFPEAARTFKVDTDENLRLDYGELTPTVQAKFVPTKAPTSFFTATPAATTSHTTTKSQYHQHGLIQAGPDAPSTQKSNQLHTVEEIFSPKPSKKHPSSRPSYQKKHQKYQKRKHHGKKKSRYPPPHYRQHERTDDNDSQELQDDTTSFTKPEPVSGFRPVTGPTPVISESPATESVKPNSHYGSFFDPSIGDVATKQEVNAEDDIIGGGFGAAKVSLGEQRPFQYEVPTFNSPLKPLSQEETSSEEKKANEVKTQIFHYKEKKTEKESFYEKPAEKPRPGQFYYKPIEPTQEPPVTISSDHPTSEVTSKYPDSPYPTASSSEELDDDSGVEVTSDLLENSYFNTAVPAGYETVASAPARPSAAPPSVVQFVPIVQKQKQQKRHKIQLKKGVRQRRPGAGRAKRPRINALRKVARFFADHSDDLTSRQSSPSKTPSLRQAAAVLIPYFAGAMFPTAAS